MGAQLRFLPPYSPDFNPIELAFAKLKAFLRAARPRTVDHVCALRPLLADAIRKPEVVADPNMHWNRWCAQLPAWGDYGTQKLFVFRKTGAQQHRACADRLTRRPADDTGIR